MWTEGVPGSWHTAILMIILNFTVWFSNLTNAIGQPLDFLKSQNDPVHRMSDSPEDRDDGCFCRVFKALGLVILKIKKYTKIIKYLIFDG